ncbi:MAG: hypothetical protein ACTHM1_06975 [Solirubrobacteraceae bacterium]
MPAFVDRLATAPRESGTGEHEPLNAPSRPSNPSPAPLPSPPSPAGGGTGGAAGSIFFALAGLLLLSGPWTTRRLRMASELAPLAPLVLIPDRPG